MTLDAAALAALSAGLEDLQSESGEVLEPKFWLDLGYAPINKILSGDYTRGFPYGRMIEIAGPSATGKTLIATLAMIVAQRAGGIAIFVDWERSFNKTFAEQLGLNTAFPYFMYDRAKTWESGNTFAMQIAERVREKKLIAPEAPIVAVLDSIAAAVPKSVMFDAKGNKRGIEELSMNDTTALARITSTTLKSVNQYVGDFDMTAIYLNQIRTKPGVAYGDPRTTPGGGSMEFYASQRLFTGRKKIMEGTGSDKEFKGSLIGLETVKNKLTRPFQETNLRLMYDGEEGKGIAKFDFTQGMIEHLVEQRALPMDGKMIVFEGKKYYAGVLAKKIDAEGKYPALVEMLPV
jgi:protein RecA